MAIILHIETSTKNCSVSIAKKGELLSFCEDFNENYSHAEKLHQFIEKALEGAKISIKDLDAVCVSKGPGSYTGLRIGVSAAKGLAYALDIPLLSIESLAILAQSQLNSPYDFIIPMIDARRMEVYTAIYDMNGNKTSKTEAKIIDQTSFEELKDEKLLFIGDGAEKCKEVLSYLNAEFIAKNPSAKDMIELAYTDFSNAKFEDIAYFEPYYLKDFVTVKKKV